MQIAQPIAYGSYLLLERIGLGGTAEIFRAVRRGRRPGEPDVALKRLLPHLAADPGLAELFLREVGALARIDHRAVVPLLDHGNAADLPFLVMPLLDGCTLRDLLRAPTDMPRLQNSDLAQQWPGMPPDLALWIGAEIAGGLAAAHKVGVVHRDLSPTNVQVTAAGEVQILDFGIARVAGLSHTTQGLGLRGKWPYLSPEQLHGGPLDGRSDLFSLGTLLVELLTGRTPFAGQDREDTLTRIETATWPGLAALLPPQVAQAIDVAALDLLLRRLLARNPAERPAHGEIVAAALYEHIPIAGAAQALATWVAQMPRRTPPPSLDAAELRGEPVTDPALDPDVTRFWLGACRGKAKFGLLSDPLPEQAVDADCLSRETP